MKLGVLGGTFNPIHRGHLHVARRVKQLFGLSEIHFVVAGVPPHKLRADLVAFEHRYAMVSLATNGAIRFIPSLIELQSPASPFSIDTLAKLGRKRNLSPGELYFIAGGDSLLEVAGWHKSEDLLSRYNFVFVMRRGVRDFDPASALPSLLKSRVCDCRRLAAPGLRACIRAKQASEQPRIFIVELGAPEVSGSQIRALRRAGKRIGHLVPASVHEYIQKQHLYGER